MEIPCERVLHALSAIVEDIGLHDIGMIGMINNSQQTKKIIAAHPLAHQPPCPSDAHVKFVAELNNFKRMIKGRCHLDQKKTAPFRWIVPSVDILRIMAKWPSTCSVRHRLR